MLVSALVMAGGAVVMLLYAEGRHADENIRLFLVEISEHYMKVWCCIYDMLCSCAQLLSSTHDSAMNPLCVEVHVVRLLTQEL